MKLPAADTFKPVAWVASRGSVLLYKSRDDGSESTFYLCDPVTGNTALVTGQFEPWFHSQEHPLQPTERPGEVWAAIPGKEQTQVGRYRTADFTFVGVATYPRLIFDSARMWVDETSQTVYLAQNGDLLALPVSP